MKAKIRGIQIRQVSARERMTKENAFASKQPARGTTAVREKMRSEKRGRTKSQMREGNERRNTWRGMSSEEKMNCFWQWEFSCGGQNGESEREPVHGRVERRERTERERECSLGRYKTDTDSTLSKAPPATVKSKRVRTLSPISLLSHFFLAVLSLGRTFNSVIPFPASLFNSMHSSPLTLEPSAFSLIHTHNLFSLRGRGQKCSPASNFKSQKCLFTRRKRESNGESEWERKRVLWRELSAWDFWLPKSEEEKC